MTPGTICAWCPDFNPRDPANQGKSHGLCDGCRAKLLRAIDADPTPKAAAA